MTDPNQPENSGWGQPSPPPPHPQQGYGPPPPGYGPPQGYGQPPGYQPYSYGMGGAAEDSKGHAAMVMGIIACCTFWIPFLYLVTAVPLSILAIVFGTKGKRLADQGRASNRGQAQAGFICGIVALALCVLSGVVGVLIASSSGY
ncbi:MAG: hypothetical protein QOK42_1946 [Frankiaceae bacterium]|nr:hypothetical protein [Frankiaceae bacterium]